jgi:voltage-gated potassium channel
MKRLQRNLRDHILVTGYGTKGSRAVEELLARGVDPGSIVVVDTDEEKLAEAQSLGCVVANGDATRDKTLRAVNIEQARHVTSIGALNLTVATHATLGCCQQQPKRRHLQVPS